MHISVGHKIYIFFSVLFLHEDLLMPNLLSFINA